MKFILILILVGFSSVSFSETSFAADLNKKCVDSLVASKQYDESRAQQLCSMSKGDCVQELKGHYLSKPELTCVSYDNVYIALTMAIVDAAPETNFLVDLVFGTSKTPKEIACAINDKIKMGITTDVREAFARCESAVVVK